MARPARWMQNRGMDPTASAFHAHLTKLAAFRQAVYQQVFTRRRDAQFELLDALLLCGAAPSLAELALSPGFARAWPSAYAAVEYGRHDAAALRTLLVAQLPGAPRLCFALDGTAWPRPAARTLPDRQYCHSPTPAVVDPSIVVGIPYSILAWVPHAHRSWAPPLAVDPIPASGDALSVGLEQLRLLWAQRPADAGLWLVAADGLYSALRFWQGARPIVGQQGGVVTRLRGDRVLYSAPGAYAGHGRPRKHGPRFACAAPATWGDPQADETLVDAQWGQVRLRYGADLHDRRAAAGLLGGRRVEVHQERAQPPAALWLSWLGAVVTPETIWRAYECRWSIEPRMHFRKAELGWTQPRVQPGAMSSWTGLVTVAVWIVYLAWGVGAAKRQPWQRAGGPATPGQVRAGLGGILQQVGSPVRPPRPRGKAPGWPAGRARQRLPRHPVVKKGPPRAKTGGKRPRAPAQTA